MRGKVKSGQEERETMCGYVVLFTFSCPEQKNRLRSWNFERGLGSTALHGKMSSSTNFDAGTPRMPFSERSAKALNKSLVDAEEAMNRDQVKTLQLRQQMPMHAMEAMKGTEEVKALLVQSEAELAGAKAWLFARNETAGAGGACDGRGLCGGLTEAARRFRARG